MVLIFDKSEEWIMFRSASSSAALAIAHVVLRILIVANWLMGAAILALLLVMPNEQWIMSAFKLSPSPEAERLVMDCVRSPCWVSPRFRSITPS
jgi:hypothetical protein